MTPTETETGLAIATPHRVATEVGQAAFDAGGNAVDAAVAACAALAVVYPHNCSLGGDLFALLHRPDGTVVAVNGSGAAPRDLGLDAFDPDATRMPPDGPHTITVPGVLGGWETLRSLGGRSSLADLLAPAAVLAREGSPVVPGLAHAIEEDRERLARDPGCAEVFLPGGGPLREGDILRQPALADSLERIASGGIDTLYGGDVGQRLVDGLRARGSRITHQDLTLHATEVGEPLGRPSRGVEVLTHPPNSQGFVLLEILLALEELDVDPDPLGPDAGLLARVFALASRDRDRFLADPSAALVPIDVLLGEESIRDLARRAREGRPVGPPDRGRPAGGDTVAVVAADDEGSAVSVIQSVWDSFGSGILEPRTGILCHNRGEMFSLRPASPNVLQGGKRPAHTLTPVMVREGGRLRVVAGSMGGRSQPQIHTQVLSRVLSGEDPAEAVAAPRWVVRAAEEGEEAIHAEPAALAACGASLRATGMPIVDLGLHSHEVGHAQYLVATDDGWAVGTDPRADP